MKITNKVVLKIHLHLLVRIIEQKYLCLGLHFLNNCLYNFTKKSNFYIELNLIFIN